ncbi:MAG: cytochrome c-type biogenesis protein CcmH [Gammaproteobacteria bacterium]|nr:cytochrome c-type biogenesis protein CcmH [Gammaproteobacteria bacterium]
MKIVSKILLITIFIATSTFTVATIIVYPFTDSVKEERFNVLIKELRCPKCQNNNLADSNSSLSEAIKDKVYEKINADLTDEEIISYLKDRYGDFISYRPPVKPSTWLIWYGPFVILLVGGFLIFRFVSARQKEKPITPVSGASESSKKLLEQWGKEAIDDSSSKEGDPQ